MTRMEGSVGVMLVELGQGGQVVLTGLQGPLLASDGIAGFLQRYGMIMVTRREGVMLEKRVGWRAV